MSAYEGFGNTAEDDKIKILTGDENHSLGRITSVKDQILPRMTKCTRGEVQIMGGVDDKRGPYGEIKVSASWGESNSSPSGSKETPEPKEPNNTDKQ